MATEKLQILIDAVFPGRNVVRQAQADMSGLDDTAQKTGRGFLEAGRSIVSSLAGVGIAIGGAVLAGKQLYDTLKEGAALQRSAEMFDNLTVSIGSTADVMLGRLQDATNGMVSNADLIAGAGQIISLGLADTEDGVVRLSTLVSKLGWDMQQVIMTFANNSVMRLDALGLSVEDVNAKMKVLEATGMSADKAFDMAVIQAGEEKLALLGDTAETTAGQIAMLETSWANFTDELKIALAETLGPAVAALASQAKSHRQIQAELNQAYKLGLVDLEEYARLTTTLGNNAEIAADTLQRIQDRLSVMTFGEALERLSAAAHSMDLPAVESELRSYTNELERLSIMGRTAAESQQAFDAMLYPDGIDAYNMALARQEKWLAAVAAGYTTAAGAIEAMRAAQVAAQEAQRQALGGEFVGEVDLSGMSEAEQIMVRVAAAGGTATEVLYNLAGGGEAVGDAMLAAAANVRAAQLGELVAGGFITAEAAAQDLQNFIDTMTLEDLFSIDRILPDTTSPESLRDQLLGPAEGIVSAVSDTVTAATEPATTAIDDLIKGLEEADATDPEIVVDDDTVTTATGNVTGLFDALTELTSRDWVVNVVYQTSGSVPGATDSSGGYSGGSGTYSPPPAGNAPGGNAPSRGGNAPAGPTSNTYNFNMPGMSPAGVDARVSNAMTRAYARRTR